MERQRVAVVVQARMSSRRLPGKVVLPLAGAPAIVRMMERVARIGRADHRVVATSLERDDDALVELCRGHGIPVHRGPLDDVLGRVIGAVPPECGIVVRLTGDCPLVDPALVDRHIARLQAGWPELECVTNATRRTFPDGFDVEAVRRDLLESAAREARDPYDREHVMPWIHRRARTEHVVQAVDLSWLRLTLDTAADHDGISAIYDALYAEDAAFTTEAVYRLLLARPELIRVAVHGSAGGVPRDPVASLREQIERTVDRRTEQPAE